GFDVFGARVSQSGAILDGTGIAISTGVNSHFDPTLAFDGTNFLVVWQELDDLFGARVSRAGAVLDRTHIPISTAAEEQRAPAVAFDGTNSLVVWSDTRSGTAHIVGTRVSRSGAVLNASGIPISNAAGG